jgi:hypothetical protein
MVESTKLVYVKAGVFQVVRNAAAESGNKNAFAG